MAETVIVGCKLPNGLLLSVKGVTLRINGRARFSMPTPARPKALTGPVNLEFGDGLTTVDKDFWDTWLKDHQDYPAVKSGHIYATGGYENAKAKAKDTEENKTGLEPLDPAKPPVKGVEPTDEMKKLIDKQQAATPQKR